MMMMMMVLVGCVGMLCVWSAFLNQGGESYFTFGPNIRVAPPQKANSGYEGGAS